MYVTYSTVEGLVGTKRDKFGNLGLIQHGLAPRKMIEHLLSIDTGFLVNRCLAELLDWCRWGSVSGVMWEATLPEIMRVIDKWELANPGAGPNLYVGVSGEPRARYTWNWLWLHAFRSETRPVSFCCNQIIKDYDDCPVCQKDYFDLNRVELGPRGVGTYNTVLQGASGVAVGMAAYNSRHLLRFPDVPQSECDFKLKMESNTRWD